VVAGKTGSFVFSPKNLFQSIFDPKHLVNTIKTFLSQSMTTKNPINCVKTQNSSETKIILELRYVFLDKKKTHKHNPPHHIEPLDIKSNCFGGRNLPLRPLSLSKLKSDDFLSLLSTKKD
jgi:hypothetical protein